MSRIVSATFCVWCKGLDHTVEACTALAAVKCGFCQNKGHSTKHCHVRKARNQRIRESRKVVEDQSSADDSKAKKLTCRTAAHTKCKQHNLPVDSVNAYVMLPPARPNETAPRFECEKCGFQHSCEEIVEEHEKDCTVTHAQRAAEEVRSHLFNEHTAVMGGVRLPKPKMAAWADSDDEEIGDWEAAFPNLN